MTGGASRLICRYVRNNCLSTNAEAVTFGQRMRHADRQEGERTQHRHQAPKAPKRYGAAAL